MRGVGSGTRRQLHQLYRRHALRSAVRGGGATGRHPLRPVPALPGSLRHARLPPGGVRQRRYPRLLSGGPGTRPASGLQRVVLDPNVGIFHPAFDDAIKIAYQIQAISALPAVAALGAPTLAYLARKAELSSRLLIAAQLAAARVDYVRAHEPALAVQAWALRAVLPAPADG